MARKKTVTPPVEIEDPRQKFLRLGQPRMVRALQAIKLIGNMSAPHYQWDRSDVSHIRQTLLEAVGDMLDRFEIRLTKTNKPVFQFSPETAPSDDEILGGPDRQPTHARTSSRSRQSHDGSQA